MEALFPGWMSMSRCMPTSMGWTLEGDSRHRMSSFGDGVLGLGQRQQVQQYQVGDCI